MYKKCWVIAILSLLIFLTACGGYSNPNTDTVETNDPLATENVPAAANAEQGDNDNELVLRLGHQTPEGTNYHRVSLKFKKLVEEKTNGDVRIDIYPFRQLGADRELLEAMQFGTLDLGMIASPPVSSFTPEAGVLDLPYLFEDWNHVNRFLDSDIADEYRTLTEDVNLMNFGIMARGFRHVTTSNEPVLNPDDLNGLSLRVIGSSVYIDSYQALGASPQSMSFGDAYTALEQGAIDGQENTMDIIDDENINEVNKHVSKTGVHFAFAFLMGSKDKFESWPEDVQTAIIEAADEAVKEINKENENNVENYENILTEQGMKIHEVDQEPFKQKVEGVYQDWRLNHGDEMLNKIQDLAE